MFLAQGNTTNGVASHSPSNTAGSTGPMRVKFLAQRNNSKRQCLEIEPGSVGSQADPKPLKLQLPHVVNRMWRNEFKTYCIPFDTE